MRFMRKGNEVGFLYKQRILLALCLLFFLISGIRAWERRILDNTGRVEAIALDSAGDVIAVGRVNGSEVAKLSGATGEIKWRFHPFHPEAPVSINKVAVDSNGDVVVVFVGTRTVVKISGNDGTEMWRKPIGGTANAFQDVITAIAIDRDDNVLTAGSVGGLFNVCKLRGTDGTELWHHEQEGYAFAVAVDPFGDVAAAGLTNRNFGVIKLQRDGQKLWQRELNGAGNFTDVFEQANAVVMDTDGSVIAVGNTSNDFANFRDFTVVKYAANGEQQWIHRIDGGWCEINDRGERVCQANDEGNAVALGKDGSVFAAGSLQTDGTLNIRGANEHLHVFKFSRDGNIVWDKAAEEPPPSEEYTRGRAIAISVDEAGNVVAVGQHNLRFTVVKFIGSGDQAGKRAWLQQPGQPPTPGNPTTATDVATDADNNVVVGGELLGPDSFSNFTVIKLRGTDGESYSDVPETVLKYAPLVYLHPDDKYRPGDPMTFIRHSELRWSHQAKVVCGDHSVADRGAIDASRLGEAELSTSSLPLPYSHNPRSTSNLLCHHREDVFLTSRDYTRPFDSSKRPNVLGQEDGYLKEGFFLDPDDDDNFRQGIRSIPGNSLYPGAPVFYEYVKGQYVSYWFFYPYDEYRLTLPNFEGAPLQWHEGDWERISIQLDQGDRPLTVFYYHHKDGMLVSWETVDKYEETHPIVFSAKGSHGSYRNAAYYRLDFPVAVFDHTAAGPKWLTWKNLSPVKAQPWYGFGGAWGEVGGLDETPLGIGFGSHYTGPLGPSRYKSSGDNWLHSVNGHVADTNGRAVSGVALTLTAQGSVIETATTDMKGAYSFTGLTHGSGYAVVASKEDYSFTPPVHVFLQIGENKTANFTARDIILPVLNLPADMTLNALVPQGTTVNFSVTATDNVTWNPPVSCNPQSGSIFPVGVTTVTCTAVDEDQNSISGSFKVTVKGASEQINDLASFISGLNLKKNVEQKLERDLEQVRKAISQGETRKACRDIEQFTKYVLQEKGKELTASQVNQLIDAATRFRSVIGCG